MLKNRIDGYCDIDKKIEPCTLLREVYESLSSNNLEKVRSEIRETIFLYEQECISDGICPYCSEKLQHKEIGCTDYYSCANCEWEYWD